MECLGYLTDEPGLWRGLRLEIRNWTFPPGKPEEGWALHPCLLCSEQGVVSAGVV